uniref:CX domain-containing protein n=1 Tax=Haemonchus contortus TaxID=6289 RepID=A0A7I4YQ48_HAECO
MVFLLLLFLGTTNAHDLSCAAHFPLRESADILKKLMEIYAIPSRRTDASGAEWLNYLIVRNNGLEIDNTRYFFNDNRLPLESTFHFTDSLLLHPVPIFVVESEDVKNWQPDRPDRTKALKTISHKCDIGQRACGLKCCYGEIDTVQKGFLELGNLSISSTYTFNDITYSIQQSDNSSAPRCTYYLSYYDALFRKRMIGGKQISAIHFSCPKRFSCCGLRCVPPPSTALLRKIREANLLSFQVSRKRLNILLTVGAAFSLIAFACITFISRRSAAASARQRDLKTDRIRREMVDTQTSTYSLHDDIEKLLSTPQSV